MHKHTFWHVFQKKKHIWVSYISWYVLGGMSLTCLPIFGWQWGRKHNNTEKNEAFWVKPHCCLILWPQVCFLLPIAKCVFFTNCAYQDFYHNIMFLWFCKTVLVKKCTPCQGVVWFSASKCHIFYTGFSVLLYVHNWSPLKPQNKLQKSRGRCPRARAPAGAYAPRTLRTQVLKKWPPSQLVFAVRTSPKA